MRIAYWIEAFWPRIGGVEVNAAEVLPLVSDRGHEAAVLATAEEEFLPRLDSFRGIPVHRVRMAAPLRDGDLDGVVEAQRSITALWRRLRPELVHVVYAFGPSVFFLPSAVRAHSSPVMVTVPGYVAADYGPGTLLGNTMTMADWVTSPSRAVRDHLLRLMPELAERSSVVHNGVAPPSTEPEPYPGGRPTILCAGRLSAEKGYDVALRAMPAVLARRPEATLLIAGDGAERPELERMARELGIAPSVHFEGWVSPAKVWNLIDRAHLVLVPSRCIEGFGLVAVEAALRERPVIASRMGGLPEVVADRHTGLLVENENARELAHAIEWLLAKPGRAASMGQAGGQRARRLFSVEQQVDAFDQIYRRLRSESPPPAGADASAAAPPPAAARRARRSASSAPGS